MNRRQFLTYAGVSSASLILPSRAYSQSLRKSLEQLTEDFDKPPQERREEIQREKTRDVNIEDYLLKERDIVIINKRRKKDFIEKLESDKNPEKFFFELFFNNPLLNQQLITNRNKIMGYELIDGEENVFFIGKRIPLSLKSENEIIKEILKYKKEINKIANEGGLLDRLVLLRIDDKEKRELRIEEINLEHRFNSAKGEVEKFRINDFLSSTIHFCEDQYPVDNPSKIKVKTINLNLINFEDENVLNNYKKLLNSKDYSIFNTGLKIFRVLQRTTIQSLKNREKDYDKGQIDGSYSVFFPNSTVIINKENNNSECMTIATILEKENMLANFWAVTTCEKNTPQEIRKRREELIHNYTQTINNYVKRTGFKFTSNRFQRDFEQLIKDPNYIFEMVKKDN